MDLETIEALAMALNKFDGGVVFVSHDERLIEMVADGKRIFIYLCVYLCLYPPVEERINRRRCVYISVYINMFDGGVVFVSHDERLIEMVADGERICIYIYISLYIKKLDGGVDFVSHDERLIEMVGYGLTLGLVRFIWG